MTRRRHEQECLDEDGDGEGEEDERSDGDVVRRREMWSCRAGGVSQL